MTQRLKIEATTRRGRDAENVARYFARIVEETGGQVDGDVVVSHVLNAARKRGGGVQITVDATDALGLMKALRAKLDGDENAYACDYMNDLAIAAFESGDGGFLGFANENYAVARETL